MADKTRNTLGDLHDYLFMELERLSEEDLSEEEIRKESLRAKAISKIAHEMIENAGIILRAKELDMEQGEHVVPRILLGNDGRM